MRASHGLLAALAFAAAAAALTPHGGENVSNIATPRSTSQDAPTAPSIKAQVEGFGRQNEFSRSATVTDGNRYAVSSDNVPETFTEKKVELGISSKVVLEEIPKGPSSGTSDDISAPAVIEPSDRIAKYDSKKFTSSATAVIDLNNVLETSSNPNDERIRQGISVPETVATLDEISSKSNEDTNTDSSEVMVPVIANNEQPVDSQSLDIGLSNAVGQVTSGALKEEHYVYYEENEVSAMLNEGKVNLDGLDHCDPVFPPPLKNIGETSNFASADITEKTGAQDLNISNKRDTEAPRESGSPENKYGVSNVVMVLTTQTQNEVFLGERNIFVESTDAVVSETDDTSTDILEVLPTPAAFNNNSNSEDNEGIKTENEIAIYHTKQNEQESLNISNSKGSTDKARLRQEDSNRFVFQIPTFYDLHLSEPTTETTVADTHLQDTDPSLVANTSNSVSPSASMAAHPPAVQLHPTAVAQIQRYDDYEDDPRDNDASESDGGSASLSPASRPRGRPSPDGGPTPVYPPPAPELEFPPLPKGEGFRVNDLGLSDGVFMFKYLGTFLSWMQPYDFPVELLRDALWKRVSVANLIGQSLPVEAGFVACLCVGVALALAAPIYALVHACCSVCGRRRRGRSGGPPAPPPPNAAWDDDAVSAAGSHSGCRRRALLFVLDVLLLLMVGGVVAMFVTNEQLSGAVARSPAVLHTALGDAATFLRNTNLQLHFVVTKSLDRAVEAASLDLENVETLLGKPIQRQLEEETGVGVALDALVDVTSSAQDVAGRVAGLVERAAEARGLALVAQERLTDLRLQVDALRRQCPAKDRSLCDTVEAAGLAVTMELDGLLTDERLSVLRRLSQGNLSATAQQARGEFQFIPTHVEQQTRDARSGVRRQLLRQRGLLDDSAWALDALSRDLGARVEEARERAMRVAEAAADLEYWRYMAAVGMAAAVLLLWTLLLAALSCGCCGAEEKARPTLFAWVGVLCPVYLALWAATLLALLVGGHGEVFVCRPLYDEPGFGALTALVDRPGVLFQRRGGFFSNLLYGNDSLDVPLRDVLRACEQNRPSYPAFRLQQVLDVDIATDHRRWEQLHRQLGRLDVDLTQLQLLTPALQVQLSSLLNAALVNLTSHRAQLTRPVTAKDLTTFADQLESVANQITDLATASRMETLASRTRRLLTSHMEPLKLRKEDLVYQLTALEVQLVPLQRQVNQSLSHLKTIQFFINNQGANISHTKSREYTARLVSYVQQYRDHVLRATGETAAPCRPVWDLFHAVRQLLCRHIMDPLNGFWFGALWCLLLLLAATPLAVRLAESYPRGTSHGLLHRPAAETPPDPPIMPEQATWSTPGYVQKMYSAQSIESLNNDTYALYEKKF